MRKIGIASGEGHRQLGARIHVSEKNIRHGVRSLAAGEPRFQNRTDVPSPGRGHWTSGFQHNDGVRIRRRDFRNQAVLIFGQRQRRQVHVFAFPLVGKHNRHVGLGC